MTSSDPGSELRQDPLSNEWVIVAPERGRRPHEDARVAVECPFCPGNEALTPPSLLELKNEAAPEPWLVRVVENRFPIVSGQARAAVVDSPFLPRPAIGAHEVVIETPYHEQEMVQRNPAQLSLTLRAYQARLSALMARRDIRYVAIFKNKGASAGTSLSHPHSQIVGLARVPDAVRRRVTASRRHFRATGHCLLCDLVEAERRASVRVIFDDEGCIAFAPFAQAFSAQVLVVPLRHAASLTTAPGTELAALSRCLRFVLSKLDSGFGGPAFNLLVREPPKVWRLDPGLHWYLEVIPRLSQPGGFELATGIQVNSLSPEALVRDYLNRS